MCPSHIFVGCVLPPIFVGVFLLSKSVPIFQRENYPWCRIRMHNLLYIFLLVRKHLPFCFHSRVHQSPTIMVRQDPTGKCTFLIFLCTFFLKYVSSSWKYLPFKNAKLPESLRFCINTLPSSIFSITKYFLGPGNFGIATLPG